MSLIERLEAAEVGSSELDDSVMISALDGEMMDWWDDIAEQHQIKAADGSRVNVTPVTTSLDAALALAERIWPHVMWRVGHDPDDGSFKAQLVTAQKPGDPPAVHGNAPAPALALCVAILKAKETAS